VHCRAVGILTLTAVFWILTIIFTASHKRINPWYSLTKMNIMEKTIQKIQKASAMYSSILSNLNLLLLPEDFLLLLAISAW
jgi:hypothetical protein